MEKLSFDQDRLLEKYQPDFAFAYGSGVFKQEGYGEDEKPMIDLVFGVDDSESWHRKNLSENGADYSLPMRMLGEARITKIQSLGPGILYNTYVQFQEHELKYGVISTDDLYEDLTDWKTLYTAGRLHKPVQVLQEHPDINEAMQQNYRSALNAALLMLPEHFTEGQLYETIAGLSYTGDSRMGVAENPKKVANIVGRNIDGFRELYEGIIDDSENLARLNSGQMHQSLHPSVRTSLMASLPTNVQDNMEGSPFLLSAEGAGRQVRSAISKIVAKPTRTQTIKGFLSSGVAKSARYAAAKLGKARSK